MVNRLIFAVLLLFAWPAMAQLADPTRPPVGVTGDAQSVGEVTGPVLQSVKIPKKGAAVAIIGGQQVKVGEMFGDSRLVRLSEREAVLEGPDGVERLQLTPGVEKTNIVTKKTSAASKQNRGMP